LYTCEVKKIKGGAKHCPACRRISSPKVLQQFSTVGRIIRKSTHKERRGSGDITDGSRIIKTPGNQTRGFNTALDGFGDYQQSAENMIATKQAKDQGESSVSSRKSHFFREANKKIANWIIEDCKEEESIMFCGCGKECKEAFSMCEECMGSDKMQEAEGYLYLKRDKNNLDRYWFKLVNQELYSNTYNNHRIQK
jgi:hypothetical protein